MFVYLYKIQICWPKKETPTKQSLFAYIFTCRHTIDFVVCRSQHQITIFFKDYLVFLFFWFKILFHFALFVWPNPSNRISNRNPSYRLPSSFIAIWLVAFLVYISRRNPSLKANVFNATFSSKNIHCIVLVGKNDAAAAAVAATYTNINNRT